MVVFTNTELSLYHVYRMHCLHHMEWELLSINCILTFIN